MKNSKPAVGRSPGPRRTPRSGSAARYQEAGEGAGRGPWVRPTCFIFAVILTACSSGTGDGIRHSKLAEVPFTAVGIDDEFWAPRLDTVQKRTIPDLLEQGEGKICNFDIVAGTAEGKLFLANSPDSDIHKILEAASYSMAWRADPELERRVDQIIGSIGAAQAPDGYLNTQFMLPFSHLASPAKDDPHVVKFGYGPERKWQATVEEWPRGISQLYVAGHLMEAAVAHSRSTGSATYLDIAKKVADNISQRFDTSAELNYADHPQVEIGLFKLYEATGDDRYLRLAEYITHNSKFHRPPDIGDGENAKPLVDQQNAFGHCVRTMYLYSGATDLVRATGDEKLHLALYTLWHSVVGRKMYIHGGIGNGTEAEQHGLDRELPNAEAYAECCASIGMGQWNHRMNLLTGDGQYADIVELEAYNSALSGLSLDGTHYFYRNVLASDGTHKRRWRYLFCCPSKLPGFVSGIGRWVYATSDRGIYVNLYIAGCSEIATPQGQVILTQETRYPWERHIAITVEPETANEFELHLRIPAWSRGGQLPGQLYRVSRRTRRDFTVKVNGEQADHMLRDGYVRLRRAWKPGDRVELELPMPIRRVIAPTIKTNRHKVALMRGPVLYCLEGADHDGKVSDIVLERDIEVQSEHRPDLLGGVTVLTGRAMRADGSPVDLTAIPYYAWDNREVGEMVVWIPDRVEEED